MRRLLMIMASVSLLALLSLWTFEVKEALNEPKAVDVGSYPALEVQSPSGARQAANVYEARSTTTQLPARARQSERPQPLLCASNSETGGPR